MYKMHLQTEEILSFGYRPVKTIAEYLTSSAFCPLKFVHPPIPSANINTLKLQSEKVGLSCETCRIELFDRSGDRFIAHCKRKYLKNIANFLTYLAGRRLSLSNLISGILFASSFTASAQDLHFSQWHATESFINPAFAGAYYRPRVVLNFRDQWPTMPQTYLSYRASFDGYIDAIHSGVGAYVWEDDQGDGVIKSTHIGAQYMFQARFTEAWALNIGTQFEYAQFKLNWNDLQFYDQIDQLYGFNDVFGNPNPTGEAAPPTLTADYTDFSTGLLFYSTKVFVGASFNHITNPAISFLGGEESALPMGVSLQAGALLGNEKKKDAIMLNPFAEYSIQDGFQQIEAGIYLKKGIILTGFFLKHNTSNLSDVVLLAGVSKGMFKFAYSYDISAGELAGLTGGAHEVSLIFSFKESEGKSQRNNQKSMLDCPSLL